MSSRWEIDARGERQISCRVRFRVRFTVRPRVRFRGRFVVLPHFARWPVLRCSGALFLGGCVCEKSMSVGSGAFGCLAIEGLRLWAACRRRLCGVARCCAVVLPVAWLVMMAVGLVVMFADRVVASRRLLLSFARLRLPSLPRRRAGRWCPVWAGVAA
jgi:hypothetical protein